MSESVHESKPPSTPGPAEDPWRVAFDEFKKQDEKMVKDYQEEIDTLLVFAGLFSAVLTAFVVESYQSLQEDLAQTSVDLLRHISHQLANSSFPAATDSSQFQAHRSDVRVNVCWFVSLLLALVVALFGIFLKQWMRTYMKWTDVTPDQDAVALRQFRYRSLETWRLGAILALLPTILQLSVILFLSGLLVFLWNLDRMVADVMAVLLAITFFLVTAATFLPVVLRSCPFRSPLSEILAVVFWRVADYAKFLCKAVRAFIESGWTYSPDSRQWRFLSEQWHNYSKITSWVKADEGVMTRYNINCWAQGHLSMDVGAMVHLCCTTQSQSLWSAAIAAITAEDLANDWALYRNRAYKNEVWWPLLGHISRFTENDVVSEDKTIFEPLFAFRRLSLTMKRCWVNFLSHSKTIACHSQSTTVAVSHMICCLVASTESTTDGSCMQAFVEVLEAQFPNFKESQINYIKTFLFYAQSIRGCQLDALFNSISEIKFTKSVKAICNGLSAMTTITQGHRDLLDILAKLACQVAWATTKDLHECVPEDLKDIMRTLQHVDASDPFKLYKSLSNIVSCAPGLIFVANHEPDLFPKPFARAIVHYLKPVQLWSIASDVDGLDIEGIDVARITNDFFSPDREYLWKSLDARTPHATELLILPQTFGRILDAYEEQVEQERLAEQE